MQAVLMDQQSKVQNCNHKRGFVVNVISVRSRYFCGPALTDSRIC